MQENTVGTARMPVKVNICMFLGHVNSKKNGDEMKQNL